MDAHPRPAGGWGVVLAFLTLGALLLAAYVHVTPFNTRCHDLGSQLYYIELVEKTHRIPDGEDCWECHQPVAYYALAAALLTAGKLELPKEHDDPSQAGPGALALQALGATLGLATLACWLMTIRLVLAGTYERILASALVTFWPTLAIQACKVGNDSLEYVFASASLWLLVSWRVTRRGGTLVGAAAMAALAMHAKSIGLVAIVVLWVSVAAAVLRPPAGASRVPRGAVPAALAFTALMAAWATIAFHVKHGKLAPDFRSMGEDLSVPNTWANFFVVDPRTFAIDPYVHPYGGFGRDHFWKYLFSSSLFGEFVSDSVKTKVFSYMLVDLTVIFLPFVVAGLAGCIARGLRRADAGHRELALTLVASIAFLVVLRLRYPYAPHGDFRFILPAAMPCAVVAAMAMGVLRRKLARRWPHVAALPGWLVVAFCVVSTRVLLFWS